MIVKIVALFLVFMAVLAMFGKLRMPKVGRVRDARCPRCGRFRIGRSCGCGRKG